MNCSSDISCLCCPTIEFCGKSTGIVELIVDGLPAIVGIGVVPLKCLSACDLRAPRRHTSTVSRCTQGRSPFHPNQSSSWSLQRAHPLPANTFSVPTITDGYARAGGRGSYLPLRRPDCTLSRLRAEEYDLPVTQSIATPKPSSRTISTLDRTLVAH